MVFSIFSKSGERPKLDVSVVIPLYNHANYVASAIESVVSQSVEVREILCIDDGSTDDSFAVVDALRERIPNLRTWSRPNRGAHHTINEGIAEAKGAYVAILNSDDLYEPKRIERCVARLDAEPETSLVYTGIGFVDGIGKRVRSEWYEDAIAHHRKSPDPAASLAYGNFVMTTSNFVARTNLFAELGGFADLRYAHDLEFLLRLLARGRKMSMLDEKLLRYRFHGSNTISESGKAVRVEIAAIVTAHLRRRIRDPERPAGLDEIDRMVRACKPHVIDPLVTRLLAEPVAATTDPFDPVAILAGLDHTRLHRELVG